VNAVMNLWVLEKEGIFHDLGINVFFFLGNVPSGKKFFIPPGQI
jgi:hypothetical protein